MQKGHVFGAKLSLTAGAYSQRPARPGVIKNIPARNWLDCYLLARFCRVVVFFYLTRWH